ncbi:formylglycine-generating enzyme family protein [Planctobacterium marinum]|uniref:Sulfatase-modifying factor enzyme-like domain-containing protein n=1 Tax=Planctobacterium marinum TaxID=1631968 RepID=A0AA48KQC7_9ALTE|nr:hypothetical protein MACH26_18840 [Planctobacterium marinum]
MNDNTAQKFRLPTEAEWEYAARAGSTSKYSWGDTVDCTQAQFGQSGNNSDCGDEGKTAPVKSYEPNNYGLYDMHGNAWEWVQDCYNDSYIGAPSDGSAWMTGYCHLAVIRGGGWYFPAGSMSSAFRGRNERRFGNDWTGFRLAQDL